MNNRKFLLDFFKGVLPIEIVAKICQFVPPFKNKILYGPFKYKTGNRKDKFRFHNHYG